MKPPIYISYCTPTYQYLADKLEDSFIKHKLPYQIFEIDDKGSWVANCAMKPIVISGAMMEYQRPVVFIDADAVVVEYPALFTHIKEDFAAHWLSRKHARGKELLSGTLFFNYTQGAIELISEWIRRQQKQPKEWDQKTLANVLFTSQATIYELPASYTQIFDTMAHHGKPVIEHYQESRKLRKEGLA